MFWVVKYGWSKQTEKWRTQFSRMPPPKTRKSIRTFSPTFWSFATACHATRPQNRRSQFRFSTSAAFGTKCFGSFMVFQCVNSRKLSHLERSKIKDDGFPRSLRNLQGSHFVKTLEYKIQKEWQGRSITDLGSKEDCSQMLPVWAATALQSWTMTLPWSWYTECHKTLGYHLTAILWSVMSSLSPISPIIDP